jgi:hypothetical protein
MLLEVLAILGTGARVLGPMEDMYPDLSYSIYYDGILLCSGEDLHPMNCLL